MKLRLILLLLFSSYLQAQIITTVAGNGTNGYTGDGGPALSAGLQQVFGIAVDGVGNLFISDNLHNVIRMVNTSGVINTVVGNGTAGFSGDGGNESLSQINNPYTMSFDKNGNLYISDAGNSRIRKVNTSGIINTVVGNGIGGYAGNGGQATLCEIGGPTGIAADANGNLYIADENNNVVRKINIGGVISTIAGNGTGGYGGDGGPATSAQLWQPTGVAVDALGNIYIADWNNSRIRKVDTFGIITTFAGTGTPGSSGLGGQATLAQLNYPIDVKIDAANNLFIADEYNNLILKVDNAGVITRVVGVGGAGYSGDGGPATLAQIANPDAIYLDAYGNLFIADYGNSRIRKVTGIAVGVNASKENKEILIYPNPASRIINIDCRQVQNNNIEIRIINLLGKEVKHDILVEGQTNKQIDISNLERGIYLYTLVQAKTIVRQGKIIVE